MVNVKDVQLGTTTRKSFAKINEVMKMPNLIEVQKSSYRWFLEEGLKEVFKDIGEISDYTGNLVLDFVDFSIDDEPKYSIAQCKARDTTYARPLKVRARLVNKETGEITLPKSPFLVKSIILGSKSFIVRCNSVNPTATSPPSPPILDRFFMLTSNNSFFCEDL